MHKEIKEQFKLITTVFIKNVKYIRAWEIYINYLLKLIILLEKREKWRLFGL